ncbi:MAG: 3-keto-disaccharide hydrolase [Luteolibacter sp.]
MKKSLFLLAVIAAWVVPMTAAELESGFISLFDGKTLDGWKTNETPDSFSVEDGAIKAFGKRCHLFYEGPVNGAKFKDFELRMDVMTRPNSNGGVFFHTEFQKEGWPSGYEVQVNNTQKDPQKSGTLYNTVKNLEPFADDTWMKYVITVKDGTVKVVVNDKELVNYQTEAATTKLKPEGGTLAIQAHDPGSTTLYKNLRIKVLK